MTNEDFLTLVTGYVKQNPEVSAHIASAVEKGISEALHETKQRASDMEAALAVALSRRYKNHDELIIQKLEKWKNKTSLCWENTIDIIKKSER